MSTVVSINNNRAVYTVQEVAYLLSLSKSTVYAMARKGEIPFSKIGDRWVITKTRLNEWVDNLPIASAEEVEREFRALERKGII